MFHSKLCILTALLKICSLFTGVSLFKWPNVFDIWNTYLTEFLERYGGTKLERARDLFEQCLETCPEKFAKAIYILYAKLELEHGSAKRGKYTQPNGDIPR